MNIYSFVIKDKINQPWPVWLGWLEHCAIHGKVASSIPNQSTYLGFRLCGNQSMFLSHIDVSLSLSLKSMKNCPWVRIK